VKVLITGSGGQVGLEMIRFMREKGWEVHASDVVDRPACVDPDVPWHILDVTDGVQLVAAFEELRPQRVFHLAAILSAAGEHKPHVAYRVNQEGTHNALEACRVAHVEQFCFASTIAAFGPGLPDPVPNEVSMRPTTMYGLTKVAGELLCEYYDKVFGLDCRSVRYPGLINAGVPGGGTSDYALYMYTDGVKQGRYAAFCEERARIPMMYMPDAIRAFYELSEAPKEKLTRVVYNITAMSPTALEIAESVRRALPDVDLTFEPDPARQAILDSWPRDLDDTCARTDWGWEPEFDLEAMTADIIPRVREMVAQGVL
jgi:threonine 3-dehydrogenase